MIVTLLLAAAPPILFSHKEYNFRREMARAPRRPKRVSLEQSMFYGLFGDYCLASNLNREKFDSLIAGSPNLRKVSSPFSWGGEFNRRWLLGSMELSYLDAPAPASLSCSVSMRRADGLEPEGLPDLLGFYVTKKLKLIRSENGFSQWSAELGKNRAVFVNIYPTHAEMILSGVRKASETL